MNLYATDTTGGTFPNWKVIASQVDPQMRTDVRYRLRVLMSGCAGSGGSRYSARNAIIGSTRVARRAGTNEATRETSATSAITTL